MSKPVPHWIALLKKPALFPMAIGCFPVLSLYAANANELTLAQLWVPLGVALGSTVVLGLLFQLLLKRAYQAWLLAAVIVFAFFSFGHFAGLIDQWHDIPAVFDPVKVKFIGWFVLLDVLLILIVKIREIPASAIWPLNAVAMSLVILPILHIVNMEQQRANDLAIVPPSSARTQHAPKNAPDIYHLVLDAYTRDDILSTRYLYDNTPFLTDLRQRGFFIADQAHSNYGQTTLSFCSFLNLEYLDTLFPNIAHMGNDRDPLAARISNSTVAAFLRARGYRMVTFETGYDATEIRTSDMYLNSSYQEPKKSTPFQTLLHDLTPIPTCQQLLTELAGHAAADPAPLSAAPGADNSATPAGQHDGYADHYLAKYRRVLSTLAKLPYISDKSAPVFVLAHMMCPHPPFVFHANGSFYHPDRPFVIDDGNYFRTSGGTYTEYRRGYREQVQFLNSQLIGVIDGILAHSTRRTIIIVQGDHGSRIGLFSENPYISDLQECMSPLLAYRLPDYHGPAIPRNTTPVNGYRRILSYYFNAPYPPLRDDSYFSTSAIPYKFYKIDAKGQLVK